MLLTITLIIVAMVALAALEIWLVSRLGDRRDRSQVRDPQRVEYANLGTSGGQWRRTRRDAGRR
jgi:hypothetical protein